MLAFLLGMDIFTLGSKISSILRVLTRFEHEKNIASFDYDCCPSVRSAG